MRKITYAFVGGLFFSSWIQPAHAGSDLSGAWRTNRGATFYITQIGNEVWWFGEQAPTNPHWSNVGCGTTQSDTMSVRWVEVPLATGVGDKSTGTLLLREVSPNRLVVLQSGGISPDWSEMTR